MVTSICTGYSAQSMRCEGKFLVGVTWLALVFGCNGESGVWLPWPTVDGARSVIVSTPTDRELAIHAANIIDGDVDYVLTFDSYAPLEAVFFPETLEDIGLTSGQLFPADALHTRRLLDGPRPVFSEAPLAVYKTDGADESYGWNPTANPRAEVIQYEVATLPCPTWGPPTLQVDVPLELQSARVLDGRNVVLFSDSGDRRAIVTEDGYEMLPEEGKRQRDLIRFDDGIVVADATGRVFYGQPSTTEVITDAVLLGERHPVRVQSLAGTSSTSLFAWIGFNDLVYWDGVSWERLGEIENPEGPLRLLEPDRVLFPTKNADLMYTADPTGIFTEFINLGDGVVSGSNIEGLGVVVGAVNGSFFRQTEDNWTLIDRASGWWALDVQPYADGFAFLSASGISGFYREDYGFCSDLMTSSITASGQLLVTDVDIVVAVDLPQSNLTRVIRFPAPVD